MRGPVVRGLPRVHLVSALPLRADALSRLLSPVAQVSHGGPTAPVPDATDVLVLADGQAPAPGSTTARVVVLLPPGTSLPGPGRAVVLSADAPVALLRDVVLGRVQAVPPQRVSSTAALPGIPLLTAREREVLVRLAAGEDNAAIGAALTISANTVRTHVSHILDKLGVGTRASAVAAAHRAGLLQARSSGGAL